MVSEPPARYTVANRFVQAFVYGAGGLALFFVVHVTASRIDWLLRRWTRSSAFPLVTTYADAIRSYAPAAKTVVFVFAVAILCFPIAVDLYRKLRSSKISDFVPVVFGALVISGLLYTLVFRPGTDSMGTNYALIARNPFEQSSGVLNKRLMMPALAYLLFLRDFQPYYIFSVVLTIALIALLFHWTKDHAQLSAWQILSLCTCSFVLFQYQYGGYPDILVYILFILVMHEHLQPASKLSLLILALLTHEASVLVGSILAWRYLDRKRLIFYWLAVIAYLLIWYWVSGQDLNVMLKGHRVEGLSGMDWLARAPAQEPIGILVAYKAMWIIFFISLWVGAKNRLFPDMIFILACVVAGVAMTMGGVDTSRLMGFAFPGFLVALVVVSKHLDSMNSKTILSIIFLLNLLLPSFNIGLNGWIEFFPGLYKAIYGWMAALTQ